MHIYMIEKKPLTSKNETRECSNCIHFNMNQWDIGFCALHQVNVLKGYFCSKFVLRERDVDSGDRESGTE